MNGARYALVDVNNCYCACEAVFNPRLAGRPLVVLSNNDGCVVSRSAEAKALGIRMTEPWHQVDPAVRAQTVALSSNYALYADMSNRVMQILAEMAPALEVFSIDEAFVACDGITDQAGFAHSIRDRLRDHLGLAVCVGTGTTKVRAKLANHVAKKQSQYAGVFDLEALSADEQRALTAQIDVGEVWGVGRRLAPRLQSMGIGTVADLHDADVRRIREQFGVVLERTVRELRGISCLPLELVARAQKQIMCSRSFGREVTRLEDLRQAAVAFVCRAAERLRAQGMLARLLTVQVQTNPFTPGAPQYHRALTIPLPAASDDSRLLARLTVAAIERLYRPGFRYKRTGALLGELQPRSARQATLFDNVPAQQKAARLNDTIDALNRRFGRGTVALAAAGLLGPGMRPARNAPQPVWAMKREHLSPAYTTRWDDLPQVNVSR